MKCYDFVKKKKKKKKRNDWNIVRKMELRTIVDNDKQMGHESTSKCMRQRKNEASIEMMAEQI
jgi:hypothetical protein